MPCSYAMATGKPALMTGWIDKNSRAYSALALHRLQRFQFHPGASMSKQTKYLLNENQMPKFWYNIQADLPKPAPPVLHPGTLQPVGPDDLAPLFPMALIMQDVSLEREIEIPEPVRDIYRPVS